MPFTQAQLIEYDGVSQRQVAYRFDLLDASNVYQGTLAVDEGSPPTIVNDVNRPIRRTLEQLRIPPRTTSETQSALLYSEDIDVVVDRVQAVMVINGTDYSRGIFLFGDASSRPRTFGTTLETLLVDQCLILDQPLNQSVSYPAGTVITTALAEQAAAAGITSVLIDASTVILAAPAVWVAGRDTRLTVLESLCLAAGFLPPYFSNDGALVCRSAPNLALVTASYTYGEGDGATGRVIDDTVLESSDLLTAPNRYVVVDSSATAAPLVGTFDVPASAPHSHANRGFYVTRSIDVQGLTDQAAADAAAVAAYAQDSSTYSWLSFRSPADPRHDTFDVILWNGQNYREQGWRQPCAAGGQMDHDLRRAYE